MYIFFWFNGFMGMWRKKGVQNIIRLSVSFFLGATGIALAFGTVCLLNWVLYGEFCVLGSIVGIFEICELRCRRNVNGIFLDVCMAVVVFG